MKDRDLSTVLSELVEASVARWGAVTVVVPGQGELLVDAKGLRGLLDEIKAAGGTGEEPRAPTRLRARAFPTG